MTTRLRDVPGARPLARAILPSRRRDAARWRRIDSAVPENVVRSGPFEGMMLTDSPTGSHIPKRLGCYEAELHELVRGWAGYRTILDVGCGEGWYVVGLGRRMPEARIIGFDTSVPARAACRDALAVNQVDADVRGEVSAAELAGLVDGRTLLIVDIEGAETEVLAPIPLAALAETDILVETHDFAAAGASRLLQDRFAARDITVITQQRRRPQNFPELHGLSAEDAARAVDESRHPNQTWLWLPCG